jgi:hypothetical protein
MLLMVDSSLCAPLTLTLLCDTATTRRLLLLLMACASSSTQMHTCNTQPAQQR